MNRCRTCKHFSPSMYPEEGGVGACNSPKIQMGYSVEFQEILPDGAIVEDDEGWGLVVAPDFGCVHHEPAVTAAEIER
jgi:hypothetical protein